MTIRANPARTARRRGLTTSILALAMATSSLVAVPAASFGTTLEEALSAAYSTNPQLMSERARLRAVDEGVPQALSGFRPTVTVTGSAGKAREQNRQTNTVTNQTTVFDRVRTPTDVRLRTTQPLYRGGRTTAQIERAENLVQRGRANLSTVEQGVLLDAATAYINLQRDQAILDLRINNVQVLRRQLDAARDRFKVGEITRTDVAQAESRVAGAIADQAAAEATVSASQANYLRVVGELPGKLEPPTLPPNLPMTEDEAQALSAFNPTVEVSRYTERAARNDIDLVRGELLPTLNLVGELSRTEESQTRGLQRDQAQVSVELTMPLYQAGSVDARVREAKQTAAQRRLEIDDQARRAREDSTRTFNNLQSTRARVESLKAQIKAAEIALDGVQQEALVGSRTVLDVLDAEQELLNAKVNLVSAQRDVVFAAYQLATTIGRLTAVALNLPVQVYDPTEYYQGTRNRWIGTSVPGEDEQPEKPKRKR